VADHSSIEFRLILTLGAIALVAVVGLLLILPYRLYERDIRHATDDAHRISSLVQASLSYPLAAGLDPADLINRIQSIGDIEIGLSRLEAGQVASAAVAGRGGSVLDDTDLRYVSTPVLDGEGRAWIAEMHFDLSPMKRESIRLIVDLVLAVALGASVFSGVIFLLFRRALVRPVRELTRCVERIGAGDRSVPMPHFTSREMGALAAAIEQACHSH
jgi:methyl-accepting chemotaxis protein